MASPPVVCTSLRLSSSVLLMDAVVLMIIINTAPLGKYDVNFISLRLYYYLWYLKSSLFPDDHVSYSPGPIVACRVLVIVAILVAISSLGVVLYGVGAHWCKVGITRRTNLLLYISLSLSSVVLGLLVALLITFRYYFDGQTITTTYSGSSLMGEVATSSWQGGMHCAIAAAVFCMASFTLDFIVLRMSPMMEKYAADAEAANSPDNEERSQQVGGQPRRQQRSPQAPAAAPAFGEPVVVPSQQQQAWHLQPVPAAPVFGQPLELYPPAPAQGEGNNSNYGVNNSAPYQYISRSE